MTSLAVELLPPNTFLEGPVSASQPTRVSSPEVSPSPPPSPSFSRFPSMAPSWAESTSSASPSPYARLGSPLKMSTLSETPKTTLSPPPSPINDLKARVAEARAEYGRTFNAAIAARNEAVELQKRATDARSTIKYKEMEKKELLASIKDLNKQAGMYDKRAGSADITYHKLDNEARVLQGVCQKLKSVLEQAEHEEMLRKRYPDPVIRQLIKRTEQDEKTDESLRAVIDGSARLDDIRAIEFQLDKICAELAAEEPTCIEQDGADEADDPAISAAAAVVKTNGIKQEQDGGGTISASAAAAAAEAPTTLTEIQLRRLLRTCKDSLVALQSGTLQLRMALMGTKRKRVKEEYEEEDDEYGHLKSTEVGGRLLRRRVKRRA